MSRTVLEIEDLGKQYRLGQVGTGTLSHDLNRWWAKLRGKEDPFLKIGETNDRTKEQESGYVWALQNVSFSLQEGDVLGVIGRNGAGKSTLLKLLSKITSPSHGSIRVKGKIASLLEVGTGFHPELTGLENIYLNGAILGMSKTEIKAKLDEIIEFSGCKAYIDTPVKRYSSGMMVRLGFSVAAHMEPDILVVDEVLAVGDLEFQKKCLGKMGEVSKSGRTILFVSHNMQSVGKLCTKGLYLKNGRSVSFGGIDDVLEDYISSTAIESYSFVNEKEPILTEGVIRKAFVCDKEGCPKGTYNLAEEWEVKIIFELEKDQEHVIAGIGLFGAMDETINTSWAPAENLKAGKYELTLRSDAFLLSAGTYYVTLGLTSNERVLSYFEKVISFSVVEVGQENLDPRIIRVRGNGLILDQMSCSLKQL